jgi:Carboxypeptidase regulatory-like domain/TonB dependent receptor-like, beta-barrel
MCNSKRLSFRSALLKQSCPTLLLLLVAWATFPTAARAQQATASINGTIVDASGAVCPGAEVVLQNVNTDVKTRTTSNSTGVYVFVHVPPGKYNIVASKSGFETARVEGIVVEVNQATTYDFTMAVGAVQQEVTVKAEAAALQTSSASLGTVIGTHEVTDLPLNGRNFTELLTLSPGVSPISTAQNAGGFQTSPIGSFVFPAVNGQSNRSNYFMLDGIDDNEQTATTYSLAPINDDIEEFKVQSHNDEAQFGGVIGGIVNVVTKSGTNLFHGAAWEYLRNDALDARNPFALSITPLKQNQFGANIGGPVLLPHYNGRNKTFFFGSYEGFRRSTASTASFYNVPTAAELNGDLSSLSAQIYNPFSTRPDPSNPGQFIRDPFPGNIIPSNLLDPNAVAFAKATLPPPVSLSNGFNGENDQPLHTDVNQYNIRLDENVGRSDRAWFRYSHSNQQVTGPNGIAGYSAVHHYIATNYGISYSHSFNPTTILTLVFGHNYFNHPLSSALPSGLNADTVDAAGGFPAGFTCNTGGSGYCGAIPNISIPGFVNIPGGGTAGFTVLTDVYQWRGDLTKIVGNHAISAGFDVQTNQLTEGNTTDGVSPNITFDAFQTSNPQQPGTGSPLASYLLGVPSSGTRRTIPVASTHGLQVDGFYFMDSWKASPKLTVNIGLRYDFSLTSSYGSASNGSNAIGEIDFNNGTYLLQTAVGSCAQLGQAPCIPGGLPQPNVKVSPNGKLFKNNFDNWQPRLGLAYRLTSNDVLRASFGMFYDEWAGVTQTAQNNQGTWPSNTALLVQNLNPITGPPTTFTENPFGAAVALPDPTPFNQVAWFQDPLAKNPYSEQWTFGVQHQIGTNTVVTANYVGSHSSRLMIGFFANSAVTPGPGPIAPRQPYSYVSPTFYDQSIGRSNYNGFQFSMKHQAGRYLSFLASYTWSKTIDVGCDGFYAVEGCSIQNPYDLNQNRSVAGYDLPHMFSLSWIAQSPFGAGKRFDSHNKAVNLIAGHWSLNGIATLTSGQPYDVGISGDIANTGNSGCCSYGYERLNLVGNPNLTNPTTAQWFNPAAFQIPQPFTFGTEGRYALRADKFKNLDLSVFRDFPVSESKRFQFRAEMFNFTNTPTWGIPINNFNDPRFGRILNTRSVERQIQLALKFYF